MKFSVVLFVILLAMCAVVTATFVIGETPMVDGVSEETEQSVATPLGHGFAHAQFPSMQSGGPGVERHGRILWFGCAFGLLQIAFFIVLLAYGGQKGGQLGPLKMPLIVGGILYAATFIAMVYTYQGYMSEDNHATFLSLPIPTAWMVYGVWPVPLIFMFLYMFTFDSWMFRDTDMARFEEILAEQRGVSGDQA